jgi:hypothetical protein
LTSSVGGSSAAAQSMPQTSLWNQMLNDDSEISDGKLFLDGAIRSSKYRKKYYFKAKVPKIENIDVLKFETNR